jgi:acid phosphatase (class A)
MQTRSAAVRNGLIPLALLLLCAQHAESDEARYIAPSAVKLEQLLSPPPAPGSVRAEQDMAAVLRAQETRTTATAAAAQDDAVVSVFRFANVLGPAFTGARLPKTMALFKAIAPDVTQIALQAKRHWQRPRPYRVSDRVKPVLGSLADDSYPSGHAIFGCMTAVLLGVMVPERRAELLERGLAYAENRVVGGVHFPTDVQAGCTAGKIIAAVLLQSPQFEPDFAAARDETRRALGLPP